jgi:hypothetical protein
MVAYLVLLLAACTRLAPHWMHHDGMNLTAAGAGLLFFGSRQPRWQAVIAAAVMALTDVYLTLRVYHYPFHPQAYLVTWAWYAAAVLIGSGLLRRVSLLRTAAAIFASATGFFLLSNFAVWIGGGLYVHSLSGLMACYAAAMPFYRNDLISTAEVSAVLFGVPALVTLVRGASRPVEAPHAAAA